MQNITSAKYTVKAIVAAVIAAEYGVVVLFSYYSYADIGTTLYRDIYNLDSDYKSGISYGPFFYNEVMGKMVDKHKGMMIFNNGKTFVISCINNATLLCE
jgi:hypothetical protein